MTSPDQPSPGRTMPYPPLLVTVVGLVVLGVVTHQPLLWSLVAAGVVAVYAGYRAIRSRQ